MSKIAKITLNPAFEIGDISPRIYSAFQEPIRNRVDGSMYFPKHPTADEQGFRTDFINGLKGTGLPAVRLPGGNFMSGWDWKDSIGPKDQRKKHLDLAWHAYYSNEVGHDEYLQWSEKVGFEPLYTINLGTGNINDAIYIVEYTNHEGGTYWSDLRKKNGHEDPYGVKVWYIGNEMDGPWQIGAWELDPKGYGIRTNEVSKAMKWVDGSIETGVCVSCSPNICHYPQWDMDVLQECYESVDYISMHYYHSAPVNDYAALLGGTIYYEDYINTEAAICDYVQTKCRSPKKMKLSFDEYGSNWRKPAAPHYGYSDLGHLHRSFYSFPDRPYTYNNPEEMTNTATNRQGMVAALANISPILTFLRHADRVKIGCMTGGLIQLAAADRDHVWRTEAYYPYTQLMQYGRGTSLRVGVDCETFDIPAYFMDDGTQFQTREGLPMLDTAAAFDKEKEEVNLFVINRDWNGDESVKIDVSAFAGYKFVEQIQMYTDDLSLINTWESPDNILPSVAKDAKFENGILSANVKRLSWNVFRFAKA